MKCRHCEGYFPLREAAYTNGVRRYHSLPICPHCHNPTRTAVPETSETQAEKLIKWGDTPHITGSHRDTLRMIGRNSRGTPMTVTQISTLWADRYGIHRVPGIKSLARMLCASPSWQRGESIRITGHSRSTYLAKTYRYVGGSP